jgi:hypothetical protein
VADGTSPSITNVAIVRAITKPLPQRLPKHLRTRR